MAYFQVVLIYFLMYFMRSVECRENNEKIDVFMLYKTPSESTSYHESGNDFVAMKLLSEMGENVRIHLVGHMDRMKRFAGNHGLAEIFYHDYFAYPDSIAEFKAIYKHQSVNDPEYEFICFYRWILYARIIKDYEHLKFSTIAALDTDVLVYKSLGSIFEDIRRHEGQREKKEMYWVIPGAFLFWQKDDLLNFTSYLTRIYEMKNPQLIKYIQNHGTYISANRPADLIPYDSKHNRYTHFSDMYALSAFLAEDTSNRIRVDLKKLSTIILPQSQCASMVSIKNGFPFTTNNESISAIHLQSNHKVYTSILFDSFKGKLTIDIFLNK